MVALRRLSGVVSALNPLASPLQISLMAPDNRVHFGSIIQGDNRENFTFRRRIHAFNYKRSYCR